MAVRTREEVMKAVRDRIGDDSSDDALSFIEDIQDTLNNYENNANNDNTNWKQRYEDNDKEWRKKYRDRFFSEGKDDENNEEDDTPRKYTFDSLFKED